MNLNESVDPIHPRAPRQAALHEPPIRGRVCPCCNADSPAVELGLTSPFLSWRAFGHRPGIVELARCRTCGHAWALRGLTDEEAGRLYTGYRGAEYFRDRHAHEPWYTQAFNDAIGSESEMQNRRAVLADVLARAQTIAGERPSGRCVDFGGDRGQMLRDLPDADKFVHDLSGVAPDPWARTLCDLDGAAQSFELALNCQVLEHVNDPAATLGQTAALVRPGGWLYLEVPDERWRASLAGEGLLRRAWLGWLAGSPRTIIAMDFLSTACRAKLGWIPPLGFWAMREHINFFSVKSLELLMEQVGLEPLLVEVSPSGISAVGRKKP